MDGIRMDERHLEPEETGARALVDQVGPGARKLSQRLVEVAHLVGHVVHPWASFREEAADRRVLDEWLEQLDPASADTDRRRADALIFHRRAVLDLRAEQPLVGREGRVEVLDRDSKVMDPPRLHASDAIGWAV